MIQTGITYPGKVLLFGEYSVLFGSDAALVPYRKVHAELVPGEAGSESDPILLALLEYFEGKGKQTDSLNISHFIDITLLRHEVENGLSLKSSIPQNKGLGSSGAICAAIYDSFCLNRINSPAELRSLFSAMESWFHGSSSGVDPLCIYLNRPLILINGDCVLSESDLLSRNRVKAFLIDTGIQSKTQPMVAHFRERMNQKEFATDFTTLYIRMVNLAVNQWQNGNLTLDSVFELSKAQRHYFERMIPVSFKDVWEKGIDSGLYAMKICGSGSGGMLLGFTNDLQETTGYLRSKFNINIEVIR